MKILNNYLKFSLVLFTLLFSVFVNGQTRGARISDNTVGKASGDQGLHEFAILDLESFEKGFLLPRMTTSQRDAINVDSQKDGGLIIFNTTTNCVNYYNQSRNTWVSLCGEMLPSNLSILPNQCSQMQIIGNYYEGRELDDYNGIVLDVSVAKAGLYHVVATTTNDYLFQAKGVFPSKGNYQIYLKGEGKPKKGHKRNLTTGLPEEEGDELTIKLNGEISSCSKKFVFVEKPMPKFEIIEAKENGVYMNGVRVDSSNTMTLTVNVSKEGRVIFYSSMANGVEFFGDKNITTAGIHTVILQAKGTPNTNGKVPVLIYGNSEHIVGGQEAPFNTEYNVKGVSYNILDCAKIVPKGEAEVEKPLTSANSMDVKVKVVSSGKTNIIATHTANGQGIRFESGVVMLNYVKNGTNEQIVKLTATAGIPNVEPSVDLTLSGTGLNTTGLCKVNLPVKPQPVNFVLTGTPVLETGVFISDKNDGYKPYITPRTNMTSAGSSVFKIKTQVRVNSTGKYKVSTEKINGVWFSAEGKFLEGEVGKIKEIELKAYGVSETDLPTQTYILKTNSTTSQNITQTVKVDFVYRQMMIYSIGGTKIHGWHLAGDNGGESASGWFITPRLVRTLKNFGWNGIVRIARLNFVGLGDPQTIAVGVDNLQDMAGSSVTSRFKNNLNKSDILFLGAQGNLGDVLVYDNVYLGEIKNYADKKGVVVYADGKPARLKEFVALFAAEKNFSSVGGAGQTFYPNLMVSTSTPKTELIFGKEGTYFSKAYGIPGRKGLYGKNIAGHSARTTAYIGNLPSEFIPIAKREFLNSTYTYMFMHKDLGVLFAGDGAMFGGVPDRGSGLGSGAFGVAATLAGEPLVRKSPHQPYSKYEFYNSWLLLNIVHWAIDNAQRNQPNIPNTNKP